MCKKGLGAEFVGLGNSQLSNTDAVHKCSLTIYARYRHAEQRSFCRPDFPSTDSASDLMELFLPEQYGFHHQARFHVSHGFGVILSLSKRKRSSASYIGYETAEVVRLCRVPG